MGDTVRLTPPCGDFVLNDARRPLVLLSGGVGITPTLSMLQSALESGREVHFLHGAINSETHAFRELIEELRSQHPNLYASYCYSDPLPGDRPCETGFLDRQKLEALLPEHRDLDIYFLGPKPFMQLCYSSLNELGIPADRIRYEFFGPLEELQADPRRTEAA